MTFFAFYSQGKDTLLIGFAQGPPFIFESNGEMGGISVWLWDQIASDLDLEYEFVNMEFNEMLAALESGEVDLSINSLTITSDRQKLYDFSFPFYISNSILVTRENSISQEIRQFFSPIFSIEFLSGLLLLYFIIFVFGFILWLIERKKNPEHFRSGLIGLWDGIWWSIVTVTTVGYGDKTPKSHAGKLIAVLWMFVALIFISSLTAGLTSNFTETRLYNKSENFQDLKGKKIGTVENSGTSDFLRKRFFRNVELYSNLDKALQGLLEKEVDFVAYDEPIIKYKLGYSDEYKLLQIRPLKFNEQMYAFCFTKSKSELINDISLKILEIQESMEWQLILSEYDLEY